jgi:uncharacterized membrane protein YcfT
MSKSASARIEWADAARGIAVLLVVLYHSAQWAGSAGYFSGTWAAVTFPLSTIRLPLLFTLAGIFAVPWMMRPWRRLLSSKVATLAYVYLLWQALTIISYLLVPNVSTPGKSHLRELLTALATPVWPQNSLWFIWALALFFVMTRFLHGRLSGWLIVIVASILSTFVCAGVLSVGNIGWDGAANNYVFFALGVFFRGSIERLGAALNLWRALGVVALWAIVCALLPSPEIPLANLLVRVLGLSAGVGLGAIPST